MQKCEIHKMINFNNYNLLKIFLEWSIRRNSKFYRDQGKLCLRAEGCQFIYIFMEYMWHLFINVTTRVSE